MKSWRTALRIARREATRSKGRSALVVAMIALPVLALTFAAVTYDMFTLTAAEKADRTMGTADARIEWSNHLPVEQMPDPTGFGYFSQGFGSGQEPTKEQLKPGTKEELLATLPGATVTPLHRGTVQVRTKDGVAQPNSFALDATSPLAEGFVEILDGRAPTTANEVALTEDAMARLGQAIGGTVTTADGKKTYTVVGQVEFPSLLAESLLFAPVEAVQSGFAGSVSWLVRTTAPITWAQIREFNKVGMVVTSREVLLNPPPDDEVPYYYNQEIRAEELAIGTLVAGLALLEIVLLAGPAFAVSARRRQRQLALVAANGGTPAHVRRIVLADGIVLGFVGAAVGVAAGIAVAFAARPLVEEYLANFRAGGYRVFPTALAGIVALAVVTGLLAALVPAFITARQNVVASLAGRRGVTRSKKRWLILGLSMVGIGTAIVVFGTFQVGATVMLAGLIIGELGMVLCTPALVGLIARVGRILPLAPRIALRDAARNRAAAAPAISAVMAAVAGSVALGLYFDSNKAQNEAAYQPSLPTGYAAIYLDTQPDPETPAATSTQVETAVRASLPVSDVRQLAQVRCPAGTAENTYCALEPVMVPELECPYAKIPETQRRELTKEEMRAARADSRCGDGISVYGGSGQTTVDDGTALATYTGATGDDLAAAIAVLRSGGVVIRDPRYIKDGKATFAVIRVDRNTNSDPMATAPRITVDAHLLTTGIAAEWPILSPAAVATAGLSSGPSFMIAGTTRMPTQAETDKFYDQLQKLGVGGVVERGAPGESDPVLWVLIGAAALITLGAAGIGTGLAAADSRPDLSTLASVGASPRMRRGLSLSQSGVIAGLGSLLGAAAGLGAALAVIVALNQQYAEIWPGPAPLPVAVPWVSLAVSLLVVPAIAMLGAGLLTRSRLPIERRL